VATTSLSHFEREQLTMKDLESGFPDFTGAGLSWVHNPDDPPDFIAQGQIGTMGLEFREWLDGRQMAEAQRRESQREKLIEIVGSGWEQEYQPTNIALAFIEPRWGLRIPSSDEATLKHEFYKCATDVDQRWLTDLEREGRGYYLTEFPDFPVMTKYLQAIRFIGGAPLGSIWIQAKPDGGPYDPYVSVQILEEALEDKLAKFSTPERQGKLAKQNIVETYLLIHGGWNAYKSNTPHLPLTLEEIAMRGAEFYAAHPHRALFNRVWFFDSLDSCDDVNQLLGFPSGAGRVRWLAELWPKFQVY
jgi:hypothetical protein